VTTLFTSTGNAENEAALVRDFLSGYSAGVADYNATMIAREGGQEGVDALVELIHKYVYTDRPLEKAAPSIINGTMRLNENAALNVGSVRDQLEWFQSEGLVDEGITLETLVDPTYVEAIGA
jgi:NitT/TauT family transport system substrate-binding protein